MGVTLSSRCRVRAGVSLVEWAMDAADLVEKSEAEGRKLRRASISSRSLIDGGRVLCFASAVTSTIGGLPAPGRAEPRPAAGYVRGLHDEATAPGATGDVMRPLPSSQVPVDGAVLQGGTYRNAEAALSCHHPVSGKHG